MIFGASRAKAVDQLDNFIEQNLTDYSKLEISILGLIIDLIFLVYLPT